MTATDGGERSPEASGEAAGAGVGAGAAPGDGGWARVAQAPLSPRENAALVWTGQEVVVFGGDTTPCPPGAACLEPDTPALRDGAAYDPRADRWRRIPDAPVPSLGSSVVVVDGAVYAVLRGRSRDRRVFASYTAADNTWRTLPAPPMDLDEAQLVAVGSVIVAYRWRQGRRPEPSLLFDPRTGRWQPLPADPLGWTAERELVPVGEGRAVLLGVDGKALRDLLRRPRRAGAPEPVYRAALLDLTARRWRRLPDSRVVSFQPGWFSIGSAVVNLSTTVYEGDPTGGLLDLESRTWKPVPARLIPPEAADPDLAGRFLPGPPRNEVAGDLLLDGHWVQHLPTGRWTRVPPLDTGREHSGAGSVWAGDRILVWGGVTYPTDQREVLLNAGFTWRPPHGPGSP